MLVAFFFTALIIRVGYIEIGRAERLQALALDQWMRDVPLQAERGEIYDRNGVLLADSRTTYTLYARPNSVREKDKAARVIADVLKMDYETIRDRLNRKTSELTVKKKIEKKDMLRIVAENVEGLYFSQTIERIYPYGNFLTQILGFTNVDAEGQAGLEAYYDSYLRGKNGYILTETDLVGRQLESGVTRYIPGTPGCDARLTIDYRIQAFAESAVEEAMLAHLPKGASCIVMNAKSGEILALAQRPSFDLNEIPRNDVGLLFSSSRASMISNVYEPGSTFKILTAAIGLDTGAVSRNTGAYCPGYHIVDGQRIKCWRTIGHGSQTFDQGVQNSCNVLFMNTALAIGADRFYDRLEAFGMTSRTGIDVSGEASGLTIPLQSVKNVDLARIGFGQAIAVTPIELVRAAAAVVNGGRLVTPYLVEEFRDTSGKVIFKHTADYTDNVISAATSEAMREILESVVEVGGGKNAKVAGYRIGGKTGTAQKYENGVIARGKYVSTFLGFTPADDPEYVALMIVDEPSAGAYYGSIVAAPYIGELFQKIYAYKGIPPAVTEQIKTFAMPDLIGSGLSEAAAVLREKNMYYELEGEGKVLSQMPAPGATVSENTVVLLNCG